MRVLVFFISFGSPLGTVREPFGALSGSFGTLLRPSWDLVGVFWGSFEAIVETFLEPVCDPFKIRFVGTLLGPFGAFFGAFLRPLWDPLGARFGPV